MISLNVYSEHQKNSQFGSIKDNISSRPIDNKEKVLRYLRNGKHAGALCGIAVDVLTGKPIPGEWLLLSDGEYSWTSDIVYYFEKYNLKLRTDFLDYVLSKL